MTTPRDDYEATLDAIAGLVARERKQRSGGAAHRATRRRRHPGRDLAGHRPRQERQLHVAERPPARTTICGTAGPPVRIANDANCFALSEATDGAGGRRRVVFGVIIGTGTGGGVVVDGQVLVGANAIARRVGPQPAAVAARRRVAGPPCYCGRRGCIETFLSGPASQRRSRAPHWRPRQRRRRSATARGGRRRGAARATLERYEERLARALASVINVLDPDVIVLGGGLSNIERLYDTRAALWGRYVFSDTVRHTRSVRARTATSSGVRGAAWLWPE